MILNPIFLQLNFTDLHHQIGEVYKSISNGYGVIGDCIYSDSGDYACAAYFKGPVPEKLEDLLKYVHEKEKVLEWIKKFHINLIKCECYGAQGPCP